MGCCGQKRRQLSRTTAVQPANPASPRGLNLPAAEPRITAFQYLGKTALVAVGPISGRYYRFQHPGAIVEVDPRDRASLAAVPNLRQVK
jgi:hypothetical protein